MSTPNELTVDAVVKAYITLRNEKAAIAAEVKERTDAITDKMNKLEGWIMAKADETGVKSFKTEHGTAFLSTTDFAGVADWDAVLDYIKANDAYDLLERRVSRNAVRSYIDSTGAVPAGVNFGTKVTVGFRKPTKKAD